MTDVLPSKSSVVSRRQIIKTAAWAAPAVAVAVATPAAAATVASVTPSDPNVQAGGSNGKAISISISATANVSSVTARLTLTSYPNNPGTWANGQSAATPQTLTDTGSPFSFAFQAFNKQAAGSIAFSIDFWDSANPNVILANRTGTF